MAAGLTHAPQDGHGCAACNTAPIALEIVAGAATGSVAVLA
jgi:hypothetical protein